MKKRVVVVMSMAWAIALVVMVIKYNHEEDPSGVRDMQKDKGILLKKYCSFPLKHLSYQGKIKYCRYSKEN